MHFYPFSELCDMTRIKDYEPDAVKLRLFPFSLRGKAKNGSWLCLEGPSLLGIYVVICSLLSSAQLRNHASIF